MSNLDLTNLNDTSRLIDKYLSVINRTSSEFWSEKTLPIVQIRFIFLMLCHDWFRNDISLEQLLEIITNIYWNTNIWRLSDYDDLDRELSKVLSSVCDSGHYYESKNDMEKFNKEIKPIMLNYYTKYKYLIEKYIKE